MYENEEVDIFYMPKSYEEINCIFQMIEDFNGRLISTKYEHVMKRFKSPHVIGFANVPPKEGKLSEIDCMKLKGINKSENTPYIRHRMHKERLRTREYNHLDLIN